MKKDLQTKKLRGITDIKSSGTQIVSNDEHLILHTPCAELPRSPVRMLIANNNKNRKIAWLMQQVNEEHQKMPNLEPLVREISSAKNLLFIASQVLEAYRDQLPSPEAIADRLRLWASSTEAAYQSEVEL